MTIESLRAYCLGKPGKVSEDMPFGDEVLVFRTGGRIFLLARLAAVPPEVNLKCEPARATELRDRYEAVKPGYHMNKKHWNTVVLDGSIPEAEVRGMVDHSFDLVAVAQPKPRGKRPLPRRTSRTQRGGKGHRGRS